MDIKGAVNWVEGKINAAIKPVLIAAAGFVGYGLDQNNGGHITTAIKDAVKTSTEHVSQVAHDPRGAGIAINKFFAEPIKDGKDAANQAIAGREEDTKLFDEFATGVDSRRYEQKKNGEKTGTIEEDYGDKAFEKFKQERESGKPSTQATLKEATPAAQPQQKAVGQ